MEEEEVSSELRSQLSGEGVHSGEEQLDPPVDDGPGDPGIGRQFGAAMLAMKCPMLVGCLVSYSGFAVQAYNDDVRTDDFSLAQEAIFNSVIFASGAVATPVLRRLSSTFGRKWLLLADVVPYTVGWLLILFADNVWAFVAGRAISGLILGQLLISQLYLKEITSPKMFNAMQRVSTVAFALGLVFNLTFGPNLGWRQLAVFNIYLPILFVPTAFASTESAIWLLDKGRATEAIAALKPIRQAHYDVVRELYLTQRSRSTVAEGRENRRLILFAALFSVVQPFAWVVPVINGYFALLVRLKEETHVYVSIAFAVVFFTGVAAAASFRATGTKRTKLQTVTSNAALCVTSWIIALITLLDVREEWVIDVSWAVHAFVLGIGFEILPVMLVIDVPLSCGLETEVTSNLQSLSLLGLFSASMAMPFVRETPDLHAAFWVGGAVAAGLALACHLEMDENAPTRVLREDGKDENFAMKVFHKRSPVL